MAPVYAAGGYHGVVAAFVLLAALAAGVMTLAIARATTVAAAAFAWAAVALAAPFLFNTFAVYPEIPAALAVVAAFTLATRPPRRIDDAVVDRRAGSA